MAQSKYEDVRDVIAGIVWEEEFKVIDETMAIENASLIAGPANANIGGWGKANTDLQSGITFTKEDNTNKIKGTLKYVEDYSSAGFDGHYFIYLKAKTFINQKDCDLYVGINSPSKLDGDKDIVVQVTKDSTGPVLLQIKKDDQLIKEVQYTLDVTFEEKAVEEPVTDGQE